MLLEVSSFLDGSALVSVENIGISFFPWEEGKGAFREKSAARIEGGTGRVGLRFSSFGPGGIKKGVGRAVSEIVALLRDGRCALPVFFDGVLHLSIENQPFTAGLGIREEGSGASLVMDPEAVTAISQHLGLEKPLTDAEVRLVSRHPLRAPRLFELRTYARRESERAARADRRVPEDAYRHVLWSYLLAKEYGADFAREVTDAHEKGGTGNTEGDKRMDLRNNSVGVSYALAGVTEERILALVTADPEVARRP